MGLEEPYIWASAGVATGARIISISPKRGSKRSTNNRDRQAEADDRIAPVAECALHGGLSPSSRRNDYHENAWGQR